MLFYKIETYRKCCKKQAFCHHSAKEKSKWPHAHKCKCLLCRFLSVFLRYTNIKEYCPHTICYCRKHNESKLPVSYNKMNYFKKPWAEWEKYKKKMLSVFHAVCIAFTRQINIMLWIPSVPAWQKIRKCKTCLFWKYHWYYYTDNINSYSE